MKNCKTRTLNLLLAIFLFSIILPGYGANVGGEEASNPTNANLSERSDSQASSRKIIVFRKTASQREKDSVLTKYNLRLIKELPLINGAAVILPEKSTREVLTRLLTDPSVLRVDEDLVIKVDSQTIPWGISKIKADQVWNYTQGQTVKVAIMDTGIDLTHPDLIDNLKGGINIIDSTKSYDDDHGHGTHVAGIVAAINNGIGVVGVAPCAYLYGVKAFDADGSASLSNIISGLQWCITNNVKVINMSFSIGVGNQSYADAILATHQAGITMVAAVGNDYSAPVGYPAAYPQVLAVTAIDINNHFADFSNQGPEVDLTAPGVDIYSTFTGGGYASLSGTSMASPHVAGAGGLVLYLNSTLSPDGVTSELKSIADSLPGLSSNQQGYGLINVSNLVRPKITSISPNQGLPGIKVTIVGSYFGNTRGNSKVTFNGTPVATFSSWSDTKIICYVPAGTTTGPVVVTVNGLASNNNVIFTTLVWIYNTGNCIFSSPAVFSNNIICFGSRDKKLYAINCHGNLLWKFTTGGPIDSSPAVSSNNTIYFGSYDGKLYAINYNGTLKWKYPTGGEIRSSPALGSDGTIYVGALNHKLYAIKPNGTLKGSYTTGGEILSSPALGKDGTIYVGSLDGKLYALDHNLLASFKETLRWKFTTGDKIWSSPALGSDGTIYIGSSDHKLYAINHNGTLKWTFTTGGEVRSSPALGTDGTIYVGSYDGKLYAINHNGTFKWWYPTGGQIWSSPALGSDGTIYFGSRDYKLYALNPNGTLKWSYTTGNYIFSSPAVGSNKTVYVGSYDHKLYAINGSCSLANAPWPMFHQNLKHTGRQP